MRCAAVLVVLVACDGSPVSVEPVASVGVGYTFTCATDGTGGLRCWGANDFGQLGLGTMTPAATPQVLPGDNWARLSIGDFSTWALRVDGTLWWWGVGTYIGGPTANASEPTQWPGDDWISVSDGDDHVCAIKSDGTMWCWGWNCTGGLGDGTTDSGLTPRRVAGDHRWASVAAGSGNTCAIDTSGTAWCWGNWDLGDCDPSFPPVTEPQRIDGEWSQVSAHFYAMHGIRADGTLAQLWHYPDDVAPTPIGSEHWAAIDTALGSPCGVTTDGRLDCVLEQRAPTDPTPIGAATDWSPRLAAHYHACAFKNDDSLWCWGRNGAGQLGDGTTTPSDVPLHVLL